jgi:hypothetical protein
MEVIAFAILGILFIVMAFLDRRFPLVGMIGGIALIMLGFSVFTSGIQVATGTIEKTMGLTVNKTITFTNIENAFPDLSFIKLLIGFVIAGAGLMIMLTSILGSHREGGGD